MESSQRWLLLIAAVFIACLLAANITAVKLIEVGGEVLPAAIIVFPVSYIVGDVLTEVYGFRVARRVIWTGFLANLILVIFIYLAQLLPSAGFWEENQAAYETILGFTARVLVASFAGYLIGEFSNSFILAKLKMRTAGRWLALRTIASTVVGQGLDSMVFITIAFAAVFPGDELLRLIVVQWLVKVAYETLATPLTYAAVTLLKRSEGMDVYDVDTDFNPISMG